MFAYESAWLVTLSQQLVRSLSLLLYTVVMIFRSIHELVRSPCTEIRQAHDVSGYSY